MAWSCSSRFWNGTRTYMVSNRTNPTPNLYVADLTANRITKAEKAALIHCVNTWPGGNPNIAALTVGDINRAKTTD